MHAVIVRRVGQVGVFVNPPVCEPSFEQVFRFYLALGRPKYKVNSYNVWFKLVLGRPKYKVNSYNVCLFHHIY